MLGCREHDSIKLEAILQETGPTSIGDAANRLKRGVAYTRSIAQQFHEKFDLVGIAGKVSTWCIAIADKDKPIQLAIETEATP